MDVHKTNGQTTLLAAAAPPTSPEQVKIVSGDDRPAVSRWIYQCSYCASYSVSYPTLLLVSSLPSDNALIRGVADGGKAGSTQGTQIGQRLMHRAVGAASAKTRAATVLADAYCAVAKKAALAIERIEDRLAERRAGGSVPRLALR